MAVQTIIRRYFNVFALLCIAVAAYFQARGLMRLVEAALGSGSNSRGALPARHDAPAPNGDAKSADAIIARNPFDSSFAPPPRNERALARVDPADPLSWPDCRGVQVLIVTESSDPWWSLTTLRETSEPRARLRRVGDRVAGKQVSFIGYNPRQQTPSVWLEGGGELCQITLFRATPVTLAVGATSELPIRATPPGAASQVQRLSDSELNVDRALVQSTLKDPLASMRSLRVVPEVKDGATVGVRLFGIRPETPLGSIGIRNGDRLETVNGFKLASPEQALQAYAHLATAQRLNVHLTRNGAPVELTLNIN